MSPAKPTHPLFSARAGKSFNYYSTDTQELWEHNLLNNSAKLNEFGWIANSNIEYQFNSEGFRDDEFDNRPCGLAFGCSFTEGIGLPTDQTYASQLSNMLGTHVWNFGITGSSLDTVFRFSEYWIQKLQPKFVVCHLPSPRRYELFNQYQQWDQIGPWEVEMAGDNTKHRVPYIKEYFVNDENSDMNMRKNLLAIRKLCWVHNIAFYYTQDGQFNYTQDGQFECRDHGARDLQHHSSKFTKQIAINLASMIQQNKG